MYDYSRTESTGTIADNMVRISLDAAFLSYRITVSFGRLMPQQRELSTEAAIFARLVRVSAVFVCASRTLIFQNPYGARHYDAGLVCAKECL
jgi:hypothetical protein